MTISAKLSDVGGLEFVVSDPTDTDDVGGFSDTINTVGAAKTAKFSGAAIMQANLGKKIGISQLKINNAGFVPRSSVVIQGGFVTNFGTGVAVTVDFGSLRMGIINGTTNNGNGTTTVELQISTDNIIWVTVDTQTTTINTTGRSYNGGLQNFRYARFEITVLDDRCTPVNIFEDGISDVTINVRSSATQDTVDGTVILANKVILDTTTQTFNTELLLTGAGQFVTLEIVSFSGIDVDVNLSEITSVKEV